MRVAMLAMLLVACGRGDEPRAAADTGTATGTKATTALPAGPSAKPVCPATGTWSACAILERLDRAGLAPRTDSTPTTEPPLTKPGLLLRVGSSDLEIYIYPDVRTRERDQALLDRSKYLDYAAPISMQPLPTLIQSANLIAILHSRNDHQRERVADALTAGPPQPSAP